MKKILELKGVQELSKGQQRSIKGAFRQQGCCNNNQCRIGPGGNWCEPGRCINGFCQILY